jgi:putative addiction module component (TIGR02574 family)
MIKTQELIEEAISLPVDLRTMLVNELLESLNPAKKEIDKLWVLEAEKRVDQVKTGEVETIPGEEVFNKIRTKYL